MPEKDTDVRTRDKAMAARRDKILTAAVMCFLENGYHQTGVRDIASRAGVSLGNLYNHFPGKHDVLVEIARLERTELETFVHQLERSGTPQKKFDRFVVSYAKYLSAPENVILSIEITSEAIRKDDLADMFMDNRSVLLDALRHLLQTGQDAGAFHLPAPARDTAEMVLDLIEGRAYHCVLTGPPMRKLLPGLRSFLNRALGV